jgi:hypothetical protein
MMSPRRALYRSATGKRNTHLYPKRNTLPQLELSVKLVVSVIGYFDCVKEISMAVSDTPGGGYYCAMLPSEETEMLDIPMVLVFPRNLIEKYYNYINLL